MSVYLYLCAMLFASGFSCLKTTSMVTPWCLLCDSNGPQKWRKLLWLLGGNSTKYYSKTSQRSSGMKMSKFIGLCIVFSFVASLQRKPLTYLKILETGICIIISIKRLRWMSVESQSPEMWYAPKAQSTKLLQSALLWSGKVREKWKFLKFREKSGEIIDIAKARGRGGGGYCHIWAI